MNLSAPFVRRPIGTVLLTLGLAPGSCAETEIAGKSTCGSGDTGRAKKAAMPARAMPAVSSVVPTGRRMNGADRFTSAPPRRAPVASRRAGRRRGR